MAYRVLLLGAAAGVGYTGHLGGEITHGEGYLTNALRAVVGLAPEREHDEDRARERPRPTPAGPIGVTAPDAPRVDFAAQIEPILLKECVSCHGPKKQKGQLRCDSLAAIVRGGKHGPAITPGDAKNSLLLIRIRGDDGDDTMPKDADPLTPTQVQLITDWINQGAKAP